MSFNIENLIPQRNLNVLKRAGLHKIAAAMLNMPTEMTVKEAAQIIGTKAFYKRATTFQICRGIGALENLTNEKLATAPGMIPWIPHLMSAAPGAALGYGIARVLTPQGTDPETQSRNEWEGGAIGGIAALLQSLAKKGINVPV